MTKPSTFAKYLLVGLGLFLSACVSKPIDINYYLLNTVDVTGAQHTPSANQISISVDGIILPEYLQSRNLIMQNHNQTLTVATKHVWAEPLADDFARLLARKLSLHPNIDAMFGMPKPSASSANLSLSIYIEHFMPLQTGDVVLSGTWMIASQTKPAQTVQFHYQQPLTADGYQHSVEVMRRLIAQLSVDISSAIKEA